MSWKASYLVNPPICTFPSFKILKIWLATTFTKWEGYARNNVSLVFSYNFRFWWNKHLSLGTSWWMLDHRSHFAIIFTYNDTNDTIAVVECKFYHLHTWISLLNFINYFKVIWELMLLCILYPLIHSIKTL